MKDAEVDAFSHPTLNPKTPQRQHSPTPILQFSLFLRYRLTAFHMMPDDWLELREPAVEWVF